LYIHFSRFSRPYEIFKRLWVPEWPAFRELIKVGLPISLMIFFEAGLFTAAAFMMGWIGTIELAAHGIAIQIASISYMIPLGFSQAASVRVGNAVGRSDREGIRLAANAVMLVSIIMALFSALVFVLFPDTLIQLFLDKANNDAVAVLTYAVPLLYMAAAFQIFDTVQVASAGNLRGLKDTKIPMIIASISYWPVGLTIAYVLAFPLGLGGIGIWGGLVAGLAFAGILLTLRFGKREALGLVKFSA